jgi:2,4-dienoyl-CoA reductase-like NADH-dependent reductase (Old Yellow Enzyme family)
MSTPYEPMTFSSGAKMKNRFMLAPLTNTQSHTDGSLSEDEFNWLTMRADGQFGLVMTCASYVHKTGKGFPGQLGIHSDNLEEGHKKLTTYIRNQGSLAIIQLYHGGMRCPADLIGQAPLCPSKNEKTGAREMTIDEIEQMRDAFIAAAVRAQAFGYDGVEVHGAHGYLITQFLSASINQRSDDYGGNPENRARFLREIVTGIRQQCGKNFTLGVRLSPERFGLDLQEIKGVFEWLIEYGEVDFIDMSLWDTFKMPEDEKYQNRSLLTHFTELDRKEVKLTAAGKLRTGQDVQKALAQGLDFVTLGRSAILHHDFPQRMRRDPSFEPMQTPVSVDYLKQEGLGFDFIDYMRQWPDFVR